MVREFEVESIHAVMGHSGGASHALACAALLPSRVTAVISVSVAGAASRQGPDGLIDDDIAYVSPWECSVSSITAPTLLLHGGRDRNVPAGHSQWLSRHIRSASLRLHPENGHISVLNHARSALRWLAR